MPEVKRRNILIDVYRFLAAIVILCHHTDKLGGLQLACGGWIFVEFFFMLSGYYLTKHFEENAVKKTAEEAALAYTLNKLLRIAPYAIVGIIVDAVALIGSGNIPLSETGIVFGDLPAHFLLLKGLGITRYDINPAMWYLTALLVLMPCISLLLLKARKVYKYLLSWLIPLLSYYALFLVFGDLRNWAQPWQVNYMLRGLAALSTGSMIYYLSERFGKASVSSRFRTYLTVLEIALFFTIVVIAFCSDGSDYALACVFFEIVVLCIALSKNDHLQEILPHSLSALGRISMPVYCFHQAVFDSVRWLGKGLSFGVKLLIGITLVYVLSAIGMKLMKKQIESGISCLM